MSYMNTDKIKSSLNYDGEITYGKAKVTVTLSPELHDWIMSHAVKKRFRAEIIRSCIRNAMLGVNGNGNSSNSRIALSAKTQRALKKKELEQKRKKEHLLSAAEKTELRIQSAMFDLKSEIEKELKKRRERLGL